MGQLYYAQMCDPMNASIEYGEFCEENWKEEWMKYKLLGKICTNPRVIQTAVTVHPGTSWS